jgi:hypothetical protein
MSESATSTYQVTQNAAGEMQQVVRQPDGGLVAIDENDQDFCDFLTWASYQVPPLDTPPYAIKRETLYFSDKLPMIEHCKRWGSMIYSQPELPHDGHRFARGEIIHGPHGPAYYGLLQAVALPPGSGPTAPGGVTARPSNVFVTRRLFDDMQNRLAQEDDPIRRLSTCTIDRCFVYIDISDFSKYPPGQEVLIVNSILGVTEEPRYWTPGPALQAWHAVETKMCIGDGYIFVLRDPMLAVYFAAYLAQVLEVMVARRRMPVDFHFRMGVHIGPVYSFWDPGQKDWNYIGDGINGGQRVLSAIGKETDDVLFISGQVRQALTANNDDGDPYPRILASLQNRGRRADKHGMPWRVYEVNHSQLIRDLPSFLRGLRQVGS